MRGSGSNGAVSGSDSQDSGSQASQDSGSQADSGSESQDSGSQAASEGGSQGRASRRGSQEDRMMAPVGPRKLQLRLMSSFISSLSCLESVSDRCLESVVIL